MAIIEVLATILGVATGLGNIPQVVKIFKTKSANDLSLTTQIVFFTSSIIWLIYGFQLGNLPLIYANIIYVITYGLIVIGYSIYSRNRK